MRKWIVFAAALSASPAFAQTDDEVSEVSVFGREMDLLGVARSGSQGVVGYADFENRPLSRVGELVENVPGVIATQHSGTGKANQYFLRGFNLDHGTDFAVSVDGVPINMRSHGHGQGYLDLNFLIPELVERIDYRKGPYFADQGDFATAGSAAMTTVARLESPLLEATVGSFGYYRALAAGEADAGGGRLLGAVEGTMSDGPWRLDEGLGKLNALARYSRGGWDVGAGLYRARWNATDQIPRRAIEAGSIDRLGHVDPDLGGDTSRYALTAHWRSGDTQATAYATRYVLTLTSNFTYFLDDPVNGDEFQQHDRRTVLGGSLSHGFETGGAKVRLGADARYDDIRVGLFRSIAARPVAAVRTDEVREASLGLYADAEMAVTDRLRAGLGLRGDLYGYEVSSGLAANSGDGSDAILSPKAWLAWRVADGLEAYANYGEGFHSNDVRGATIAVDPVSGDPADAVEVLPRARGAELGVRVRHGAFTASAAVFDLKLESELVFVGDAGGTEPSDASHRQGVELTAFWRPADWLALDGSFAATRARFEGVAPGMDRIPGAVEQVAAAGATARLAPGLTGTLRVRHLGEAPLIEDGSVASESTTLVNLGLYYERGGARLGLEALNLTDARDADITYFYPSRLPGEPAEGAEDIHLHPVEPFQLRLSLRRAF